MPALTVMTFNIRHGSGTDGRLDLERIVRVIEGERPAVVGLQEVDRHWSQRSAFADQPSWLAGELGMHVVYGVNVEAAPPRPGEPRRQYGTAILARGPIVEWDNTPLPRSGRGEQRGLLRARILVDGVPLTVCTTHLQFGGRGERLAQAREIRRLLDGAEEPFVLMGDVNATPRRAAARALTGMLSDAWAQAGRGRGHTFPSGRPRRRIDYVLTSASVVVRKAAVVTSEPAASDHLPVVAEIVVGGEESERAG
ncbi:endonuclease/exonuclease/phosphatase family protein [Actinomadura sp. SCN-SB]|uniref:endonuclease/exonuclease/phosphatase family protein n=1 Tax=Actinomadura sp. SCN-SB TaxID=3373092 RepID=UPI003751EC1A